MTKVQDYRIQGKVCDVVGTKITKADSRCATCGLLFGDNRPNAIRHAVAKSHKVEWVQAMVYDFTPKGA